MEKKENMGTPTVRRAPPQVPQSRTTATTRLDVSAYLLVRGFAISDVKLNESTATFTFKDPDLKWVTQRSKTFTTVHRFPRMSMPTHKSASAISCGKPSAGDSSGRNR